MSGVLVFSLHSIDSGDGDWCVDYQLRRAHSVGVVVIRIGVTSLLWQLGISSSSAIVGRSRFAVYTLDGKTAEPDIMFNHYSDRFIMAASCRQSQCLQPYGFYWACLWVKPGARFTEDRGKILKTVCTLTVILRQWSDSQNTYVLSEFTKLALNDRKICRIIILGYLNFCLATVVRQCLWIRPLFFYKEG